MKITISEAAQRLDVSLPTIYARIRRGALKIDKEKLLDDAQLINLPVMPAAIRECLSEYMRQNWARRKAAARKVA
jgi:hypothetical protein